MTFKPKFFLPLKAAGLHLPEMLLLIIKYMERQWLSAVQLVRVVVEDAAHSEDALVRDGP